MRVLLSAILFISMLLQTASAQNFQFKHEKNIPVAKVKTIRFTDIPESDFTLRHLEEEAPEPWTSADSIKKILDAGRKRRFTSGSQLYKYQQESEDIRPDVHTAFDGLPTGSSGIPNDNNLAISNDGMVISVINSNISIFDSTGNRLAYRTLENIVAGELPNLNRTYDPKVVYDPESNRFILIFLQGSTSNDTRIIVGFTATADPLGDWNFYAINGNPFGGNTWSDYPIIGISKEDLYVTVNILRDNESWQEGFTQSVIWQVNKQSGYDGNDSIYQDLFHDLKFNNQPIWSICAVPGGSGPTGPGMHFLSVRPGASSNDSVFLHHITDHQQSGNATYELKVLKTSKPYGVPPSALQPDPENVLQTNDTRVLSAFEESGYIQYVQSSIIPETGVSGIYHGLINLTSGEIENNYITSDTFEYAYPSIAHVGEAGNPMPSAITFSHVSELDFPGTSVVFHNRLATDEALFSPVVIIREGEVSINRLNNDSNERWGDYTGIQKQYNSVNRVWMGGSYGKSPNRNSVWIGSVEMNTTLNQITDNSILLLPNPAAMMSVVRFNQEKAANVAFRLYSMDGKLVYEKEAMELTSGTFEFSLNTSPFRQGLYELVAINTDENEVIARVRVAVQP